MYFQGIFKKQTPETGQVPLSAVSSSYQDLLEARTKKVELIKKIDETRLARVKEQVSIEKIELENEGLQLSNDERRKNSSSIFSGPVYELIAIAQAWCIDNDRTVVGSEPVLRSLWDTDELQEIKNILLQKAKKLQL